MGLWKTGGKNAGARLKMASKGQFSDKISRASGAPPREPKIDRWAGLHQAQRSLGPP
jgi:hypothetical protein